MEEHPNARLVRQALAAFNQGDFEQFGAMMADDINWHEVGASEPVRGKEAVFSSMGAGGQDFEIEAEVHDVVANDDHTLALINATGKRGDQTFHYQTVEVLHFRDGKVTDRWSFANDTQAVKDFFS
ncbi:MAG TPA: nuclear transport factor 2 family protein [Acidimicrobiia bacterium]|nr:nuclear transport factor 2 family protein [Acidimicrobiia bacterium]